MIIYATDGESRGTAPHVRHRHFTRWVQAHSQGWRLLQVTPGPNSGPDRAISSPTNGLSSLIVDGRIARSPKSGPTTASRIC